MNEQFLNETPINQAEALERQREKYLQEAIDKVVTNNNRRKYGLIDIFKKGEISFEGLVMTMTGDV